MEEEKEEKNEALNQEQPKQEVAETPKKEEAPKAENKPAEQPKVEAKPQEPKKEETKKEKKPKDPKKKSGKKTAIGIILAIVIILAIIVVIFCVFSRKTIDLSQYLKVEYNGYNGYATATVSIDKDLKSYIGDSDLYKKFVKKAELEIKDNEGLSNGDELVIEVSISENWLKENKLRLKSDTVTITVEGLEEADVVDVFADIEVEVKGVSPNLEMSVNNNNSDSFIRTVTYSLSQSSGLSNGDKVTITANYSETAANEAGKVVANDTMEYEITGYAEYISKVDEFSDDIKNSIKSEFVEEVKDQTEYDNDSWYSIIYYKYDNIGYNETFTTSEPELVKLYLLTPKNESSTYSWYSPTYNKVYGIYKVSFTSTSTGAVYDWYYVANVSNVAIKDGALYEDDDNELNYDCSSSYDDGKTETEAYNDIIDSQKSDYVIETIN